MSSGGLAAKAYALNFGRGAGQIPGTRTGPYMLRIVGTVGGLPWGRLISILFIVIIICDSSCLSTE